MHHQENNANASPVTKNSHLSNFYNGVEMVC